MNASDSNLAELYNRECDCTVTDLAALHRHLDARQVAGAPSLSIVDTHPHLFSEIPVFLQPAHAREMQRIVAAVDAVAQLPAYRHAVLDAAPSIARINRPHAGVFLGYDFHISADGPQLIEINTNAGGAFLNVAAHEAQHACCRGAEDYLTSQSNAQQLENELHAMFDREWRAARGTAPLRSIAIVDKNPKAQFLYPEFLLAQQFFEARGIRAHIADPSELELRDNRVRIGGEVIDLIYNRLTDFYLEEPENAVLRECYERDLVVLTPHPRAHALFANKQNLAFLSDAHNLEGFGASPSDIEVLTRGIPRTQVVEGCEEKWWQERKQWFFKPSQGFGSRGVYRGDKITRRAFSEVMAGRYVAQKLTPAGERWRTIGPERASFKVDVRCYAHAGKIQLMAARLYQGQVTNFRTAGGGFASVYVVIQQDGSPPARG